MPLDHYVSQVHLRNFYSPDLDGKRMFAIRKRDMFGFKPRSEDVCRRDEGNTNSYLVEPRIIEEFLKTIEPKYNAACNELRDKRATRDTIRVIAGFTAYVGTCSPTAMRLHSAPLREMVMAETAILEARGELPELPDALGVKTLDEAVSRGVINVKIDEKYPQAIGVTQILKIQNTLGNSPWEILLNDTDSPFFTSDFPAAVERTSNPLVLNRLVPLAPDLAIRIHPDVEEKKEDDSSLFHASWTHLSIPEQEVKAINRLIVRSAEEVVFFRDDAQWVRQFVQRNSKFRIEPQTIRIPVEKGHLIWASQAIAERQ